MCPACQSAVVFPPTRPRLLLARRIARVFGFFVLLGLCLFAWWRVALYRAVNKQFARIRVAGYPVSGAEWNEWRRPVADPENGALVFTQAFALVRTFPDSRFNQFVGKFTNFTRTNKWPAATRELAEAYLQTNAPALAKVRKRLLSRFRYPADFSYGLKTPLTHLAKLKQMAASLNWKPRDAEKGRADEWPEQVDLQLKLAGTL